MSLTVLVPKPDTPQRRAASFTIRGHGRPSGRMAGGWIADLVGLQQCVTLCPFCVHKFNPRRLGYEPLRVAANFNAFCADCGKPSTQASAFIHQSFHDAVGDERRSPGKGRWARSGRRPAGGA